jgi:alpha-tubulin suppressor-like RCC1 family protein
MKTISQFRRNSIARALLTLGILSASISPLIAEARVWTKVSAGGGAAPAPAQGYELWAWGKNNYGQLGDGTSIGRSSPVQIGALTNWKEISAGAGHTAAIKTDGTLWAWGGNSDGQLGDGTSSTANNKSSPIQIGALTTWSQVAAGSNHTTAIKTDGTLWAWGRNNGGQLGDGTSINKSLPAQIGAMANWKQASSGYGHITAIKTDGTLWAWGANSFGKLGDGTVAGKNSPIQIGALTNWSQVAAGSNHTTAIKTDGTLWAWGRNNGGQLGDETVLEVHKSSPVQIGALTNWKQVAAGDSHTAAIKTNGTLWAWGQNNLGQFGNGTLASTSSPIQIGALTNWNQVAAGNYYTIAIKTDRTLWAWGQNTSGELGDGTKTQRNSSIQIGSLTNWKQVSVGPNIFSGSLALKIPAEPIKPLTLWRFGLEQVGVSQVSAGNFHTTAIKTDGTLWAWGSNSFGQLGVSANAGINAANPSPIQVGALTNWSQVSAGTFHTTAIKTDGTLWAWGRNNGGQLGVSTNVGINAANSSPIQIGALTNWKQASAGYSHTSSIKTDGTLWAWGKNNYGQLGVSANVGTNAANPSPIQVGALTNWSKTSIGFGHTTAIKTDGTLWAWGNNNLGQLGVSTNVGTNTANPSPIQIGALTNWSQVSAGASHTTAIKTNGTLWSWGLNNYGQLGVSANVGTNAVNPSPVQVGALTNWSETSIGYDHTTAIKTDGTLWAWGNNNLGQLGFSANAGSPVPNPSPIQIGALTNWAQFSVGFRHTSAIKTDGTLWAWGRNNYGQLGDGTSGTGANKSSPVQVPSSFTPKRIRFSPDSDWKSITVSHGIKNSGALFAWGPNNIGQLGDGTQVDKRSPIQIGALTNWGQVAAVGNHTAAIKTDGTLWAWGSNFFGQLGDGTSGAVFSKSSPVQIGALTNWKQVSVGGEHTAAIKTDGTLWAWGSNFFGQLGDGASGTAFSKSSPIQIGALTNWKQVSASNFHNIAIKADGTLWAWGHNSYGQLGDGTTTSQSSPVQIGALMNWRQASAGSRHITAIKTDGTLWSWGYNQQGQFGDGKTDPKSSPIQIGALTNWKHVSAGYLNTSAIKTDGTLWTWGWNQYGQLGDGTIVNKSSPIQIGTKGVEFWESCALATDATYCLQN